jgi:hypothetical protein
MHLRLIDRLMQKFSDCLGLIAERARVDQVDAFYVLEGNRLDATAGLVRPGEQQSICRWAFGHWYADVGLSG